MEATVPSQSLKFTIKLKKRDSNVSDPSTTADCRNNAEEEGNALDSPSPMGNVNTFPEDVVHVSSAGDGGENHVSVDKGDQICESSQYQLVLYDPAANALTNAGDSENAQDLDSCPLPTWSDHPFSDHTPRVLPSIGAFTVQCANCMKWRLIPTKEKYEEIREHIIVKPFFCETSHEWRPDSSCNDPPDITQDGSRLWAIDKPNIAKPPTGWQRLMRIRGEGGTRFADVYYVAPSGKTLRSRLEIQRYLDKHPEYMNEEVSLARFSFQTPKPLQEGYVRKRSVPVRPALQNDAGDLGTQQYLPPSEVARITWVSTDEDTDLQQSIPEHGNDYLESPGPNLEEESAKRRKMQSGPSHR